MNVKATVLAVLVAISLAAGGRSAFAQSASAYKPLTPSDAPYIYQAGYGVYNTDTSAAHSVTADYGVYTTTGSQTWSFTAGGYNNGGTLSCTAYAIKLSGAFPSVTGTTASNTSTGGISLSFGVTVSSAGTYAVSSVCSFPPSNGAGNGTIFGVSP